MAFSAPLPIAPQGFKRLESESRWNYQVRGTETIDLWKREEKNVTRWSHISKGTGIKQESRAFLEVHRKKEDNER